VKLTLHNETGINIVRSYQPGRLELADQVITAPVLMSPAALITDWTFDAIARLDEKALHGALAWEPDVLILGTGEHQQFPPSALLAALARRGIGLEVMTTAAACRTYNVLTVDGRDVAAALIV
jgi:uncharacterized protein